MPVPYHEAAAARPPPSSPPSPSQWGPYSGAGEFSANMVIILIILFCALVLVLALNAVIRYLLCSFRRRRPQSLDFPSDPEKGSNDKSQVSVAESLPALIFSASTELAGNEAECAICLAEFADGDRVRVLPACNHGFHVSCIEKWLVSRNSCPTCRATFHVAEV